MLFRRAVLLIHGFAGGVWDHIDLANALEFVPYFDVYNVILPGHDKSIITSVSKDDWIRSVEVEVEKLIKHGYKSIYLMGHSMGGVIASHIASKYSEVKKLVLAAPAFKYLKFKGEKLDVLSSLKYAPKAFKDYDLKEVIGRIFKSPLPTTLEFIKLVDEHTDCVKKIDIPTLIIHGDCDNIVPLDSAMYVYDNIKSDVVVLANFKGVTHDVFKGSRGNEVISCVEGFFKKPFYHKGKKIINL